MCGLAKKRSPSRARCSHASTPCYCIVDNSGLNPATSDKCPDAIACGNLCPASVKPCTAASMFGLNYITYIFVTAVIIALMPVSPKIIRSHMHHLVKVYLRQAVCVTYCAITCTNFRKARLILLKICCATNPKVAVF